MHSNLSVTDGVYGILSKTDIRKEITELGKQLSVNEATDVEELNTLLMQVIKRLESVRSKTGIA